MRLTEIVAGLGRAQNNRALRSRTKCNCKETNPKSTPEFSEKFGEENQKMCAGWIFTTLLVRRIFGSMSR